MPPDKDLTRLFHMWEAAREAVGFAQGHSRADLDADRLLQLALVRLLEIIGEAATGISDAMRVRIPGAPWRNMIGMRNRMIHAYFDIELDIVWKTVTDDLPTLISEIEPILNTARMLR